MESTETPRERLLAVALAAFVNRGFEAVGVQELVEQAGVTKPTLYHHYGSKRGVLEALCTRLFSVIDRELEPAFEYTGDLPQQLTAIIRRLLDVAQSRPAEFRLLLLLQNAPLESAARQAGKPVIDWLHARMEALFDQAAARHGNMAGRAHLFAVSLIANMFACGLLIIDGQLEYDRQLPHRVMHQFSYGVYS